MIEEDGGGEKSCKEEDRVKRACRKNSNCDFYLIFKMWQCLIKIIRIQNILSFCENQELYLKHSAVLIYSMT